MRYLVDANVLSEPTKPFPNAGVVAWLQRYERDIAVDPIILGAIRFGILLLPRGRRRTHLEPVKDSLIAATALVHGLIVATRNRSDFEKARVKIVDPFSA